MLNKQELITAFQEFVDNRLIPGKWENDERRVYSIIIDDVRIENLNIFIKNHFTNTERSAWWTFKQVTSNYIDAASYFDDHEISLMFYTCFSYRVVYQIQHRNKGISSSCYRSNPQFQSYWIDRDTKYLAFNSEWNKIIPATPNNYYIPQHFDITATNLGGFEEPMDKTLKKARSIYTKLYNLNILNSIEEYKNLINSVDDFNEKEVKIPRRRNVGITILSTILFVIVVGIISIIAQNNNNIYEYYYEYYSSHYCPSYNGYGYGYACHQERDDSLRNWTFKVILCILGLGILKSRIDKKIYLNSEKYKFELLKKFFKKKLLEVCEFLLNCFYSSKNDELLSKLEEYENIFNKKHFTITEKIKDKTSGKTEIKNHEFSLKDEDIKKLPNFKKLEDAYKQIKENIEEWWKISWWKSINDEYNDKLWWDYDINSAKEKFADDEEL